MLRCNHCGAELHKSTSEINRAKKIDAKLFCNRVCFGLDRRKNKTKAQKVSEKRLYDMRYRELNAAQLKEEKAAYFQRTYDPEQARIERKNNMPRHVEYCRRPEYRQWKAGYDKKYLAEKRFGTFAEAYLLLREIDKEIAERMTRYDIYLTNGTINKAQMRRRSL